MKISPARIAKKFIIEGLEENYKLSNQLKNFAKKKGIKLSGTPEAKHKEWHVMPTRLPKISSRDISERYAFANSMSGYLSEQVALLSGDEANMAIQLEFFDAEFTIRFNDTLDTRKYMVEAYRQTNAQRKELVDALEVTRAALRLLEASLMKYDKIASSLSREITRRNNEREKQLYSGPYKEI